MSGLSLRGMRRLFQNLTYRDINISKLSNSWTHQKVKLDKQYLLIDCVVYPRTKLQDYANHNWDSSELVDFFGLEKDLEIETEISFHYRNPKNLAGGLSIKTDHIRVYCQNQGFEINSSHPIYNEMLPKYSLHFWRGLIVKKSDWSDLIEELQSSKVTLCFPAILVFENDKQSKIPGSGNLRIYSYIPNLSLLMRFLDSNELI
jgi:hypothetical protein